MDEGSWRQDMRERWPIGTRVRVFVFRYGWRNGLVDCVDEGWIGVRIGGYGRQKNSIAWYNDGDFERFGNLNKKKEKHHV